MALLPATLLFVAVQCSFASAAPLMEKLGAFVMQAAETSPVNWHGRTLLVETVSGNTPGVWPCCKCTTFGCVANASAHVGYSDCSACTCSAQRKKEHGSCAPEFFRIRDKDTLEILVSPIPNTEGFGFGAAFVDKGRLWVYGTNLVNGTGTAVKGATHLHQTGFAGASKPADTEAHVRSIMYDPFDAV